MTKNDPEAQASANGGGSQSAKKSAKKQSIKKGSKKIEKGKKGAAAKTKITKPQGEIKFYYFDCYAIGE